MKVLIIGGTGILSLDFLILAAQKHEVYVLNRNHKPELLPCNVNFICADIRDSQKVAYLIKDLKVDVIVDFLSFNKEQLKNTLDCFKNKFDHYIFISSADVYNRFGNNVISELTDKPNLNWDYGIDKEVAESFLRQDALVNNYHYTIVQPYITYGKTRIPYGLSPMHYKHYTLIFRIKAGKPLLCWDMLGDIRCTLMHTRDFAFNLEQMLLNKKVFNSTFLLTGEFIYTWKEVCEKLYDIIDKEKNIVFVNAKDIIKIAPMYKGILLGDRNISAVFDNSKIKKMINYQCYIDLDYGLNDTLSFYANNNFMDGVDFQFDAIIDRIIAKNNNAKDTKMLHFIDYIETATIKDRLIYFVYRYFPFQFVQIALRFFKGIVPR